MGKIVVTQLVLKVQPEDRTPFTYTGSVPVYVAEWESEDGVQGHMIIIAAVAPGTTDFQEAPTGSKFIDTNANTMFKKVSATVWEPIQINSVNVAVTAGTTQTQAGATALTGSINQISVCANAGDGVELPTAEAGKTVVVINNGALSAQVWPASSDTINGGSANAVDAKALGIGESRVYVSYDAVNWETLSNYGLYLKRSVSTGLTAGTTQTQAGALQLVADVNQISTCANASDAAKLPLAEPGMIISIVNNGAQVLAIWPAVGDAIDAVSANGVDTNTLAAALTRQYVCYNATNWETLYAS